MKGRKPSRQRFLFKGTRKMCIHWGKHKNNGGQYATCGFEKDKRCKPMVCWNFVERVKK